MYKNDSGNINLWLKDYSYTPCFCGLIEKECVQTRIGSYSLVFRNDFCLSDSDKTSYMVSSIVNAGIYPMPFTDKNGESFDNKMRNLQLG